MTMTMTTPSYFSPYPYINSPFFFTENDQCLFPKSPCVHGGHPTLQIPLSSKIIIATFELQIRSLEFKKEKAKK